MFFAAEPKKVIIPGLQDGVPGRQFDPDRASQTHTDLQPIIEKVHFYV